MLWEERRVIDCVGAGRVSGKMVPVTVRKITYVLGGICEVAHEVQQQQEKQRDARVQKQRQGYSRMDGIQVSGERWHSGGGQTRAYAAVRSGMQASTRRHERANFMPAMYLVRHGHAGQQP